MDVWLTVVKWERKDLGGWTPAALEQLHSVPVSGAVMLVEGRAVYKL